MNLDQVVQRAKADIAKKYVYVMMPIPQLETLLNGLEELKRENAAMKEALEWYASESIYNDAESAKNSSAFIDQGYTARFVLSTLSKEQPNEQN